ncbi:MAG: DUF4369 domain-containing protein, partial [Bacteroidales bacterium]|nr:DUF4369 domain-containing protein [Bacteroidales bacterium]
MRKHFLALAAMVLIAGVVSAVPKKGYKITVQIKNAKDTVLYMGHYYGKYTPAMDTARINKKGQFVFENSTKEVKPGVYFFSNPEGRYAEFIINLDRPNFTLKTDEVNWITNMQVSGSPENKAFYDYQKLSNMYYHKVDSINKNTADKAEARKKALALRSELDSVNFAFINAHPEYLFCKMLRATREVDVPVTNEKGDTLTKTERAEYYGEHYFDNMSLDCDAMVRTPSSVFYERVERFFD